MAKGKRTYVGFYSEVTGNLVHVTNINKKNVGIKEKQSGKKLTLRKYNKLTRQHEVLKMKEIKKGSAKK